MSDTMRSKYGVSIIDEKKNYSKTKFYLDLLPDYNLYRRQNLILIFKVNPHSIEIV